MSVGDWDPGSNAQLDAAQVERLLAAAEQLDAPDFGLSADEVASLAPLARTDGAADWRGVAEGLQDAPIERLIRLLTLAEGRFPAWESGARSPVIALVAVLKARGSFDPALTRWIKANSENRFLPHGSLLDRL